MHSIACPRGARRALAAACTTDDNFFVTAAAVHATLLKVSVSVSVNSGLVYKCTRLCSAVLHGSEANGVILHAHGTHSGYLQPHGMAGGLRASVVSQVFVPAALHE